MRNEVLISKDDYLEILKALDVAVCILDRSDKREDSDNRAYSLAIACAQVDLTAKLAHARKLLCELVTPVELSELDDLGSFDDEIPQMAFDATLSELQEQLSPYLVKLIKYEKDKNDC